MQLGNIRKGQEGGHREHLSLGADAVLHSTTKYISGHGNVIGGAMVMADNELRDGVFHMIKDLGACPSPMDAWLANTGLKTLPVRMRQHCENAQRVAEFLEHDNHKFVHGDICDGPLVERLIDEHQIDAIVNFAAESHVDRSITGPKIFIDTNVSGTLTLLEAARDKNVGRFIQVSTDEVYGSLGSEGMFTEQTPLSPNSPYSASKIAADKVAESFHRSYGAPIATIRPFNTYGPRQSARASPLLRSSPDRGR